ncbi:phosphofructokinase [Aneurinibacillus migulanus]|uniref:1-phosphofructokinase n=1 Tax=Aneurinibacillus migulanus TaxID=47500 RepID=UPI0005BB0B0E|nr:1-phosphofructokinase [Aneurinibacillus migulanus]KIV53332.1 phosphofructokinase [Aneurinibacillus migulanus]KPD05163.1 phosphofructokinase [Aneurinibacillus migulanus]MCP1356331.1 1-phosphofructokinase [Aneurinibacillus migulanus]CEH30871.1 Tagatose-6-phosphate kinase [Aneurinibacillus migulanus]
MIYTVTLNPSIDYFVEMEQFIIGKTNRIVREAKRPGGKGINVSRVLKRLDVDTEAFGFIGGFTGRYIDEVLQEEGIRTDFITVHGDTRINVKLRVDTETEINGSGPAITEEENERLFAKLERISEDDILVISGSIPGSLSADLYGRMAERTANRAGKLVVDTTKEYLLSTLPYRPFLVKPNQDELGELFDISIQSVEEAVPYGKKLVEMGAQNVIVSMGGLGALFFNHDYALYANVPEGKLQNSVGAGDSVVAGFIAAYLQGKSVPEVFRYAVTAGSATAFSTGFCTSQLIEELIEQVHVTYL